MQTRIQSQSGLCNAEKWITDLTESTSNIDAPVIPGTTATPVTSSEVGTTEFKDAAQTLIVKNDSAIVREIAAPYNISPPLVLLTKAYLLNIFNWTNVWTGTSLAFPYELLNQPYLLAALERFKYFRANVKVTIKLQTTPYHQGSLLVGWLGGWESSAPLTIYTLSGCHAVVLSASTQDSVDIILPYLAPGDWMQTNTLANDCRIARLFIQPLNTLLTSAASMSTTVPVQVYASFQDIEVSGYTANDIPSSTRGMSAHSGSGQKNTESANKVKSGIDSKSAVSVASKLLRKAPVVGPAYGAIADFVNSIAGDLSKPLSQASPTPIATTYMSNLSLASGLSVADQVSMYPNANLNQSKIFCGMATSHMTVSELAQQPMLAESYTLTAIAPDFTMRATPLYFAGPTVAAHDWLYYTSYAFRHWRGSIKYLFHICVPAFYSFRVRISLQDQNDVAVENPGELPSKVIDVKGDTWIEFSVPYHRECSWTDPRTEVQTGTFALIPLVKFELITAIVGSSAPATPVVYVNAFRAGGEDTSFAGLMGARDGLLTAADPALQGMEAHSNIAEKFRKPFETAVSGITQASERGFIQPEIAGTVSDCLKRASWHIPLTGATPPRDTYPSSFAAGAANINYTTIGREPFHYFSYVWRFWRGSRILRSKNVGQYITLKGITASGNPTYNHTPGDGASVFFTSDDSYLRHTEAISVPWSSVAPWSILYQASYSTQAQWFGNAFLTYALAPLDCGDLTTLTTMTIEAGDDFILMQPLPFFPLAYYPAADIPSTTPSTPAEFTPGELKKEPKRRTQPRNTKEVLKEKMSSNGQ